MKLLLDTHVLIWVFSAPERLPDRVRTLVAATQNVVAVSSVCVTEIAIKQSLGKLTLPAPVADWLPGVMAAFVLTDLPFSRDDALRVADLPWLHRDPFDRMLIAQALGGWTLVTADDVIRQYPVPTLW